MTRRTSGGGDRVEARDRGLRRVRTATGWITAASAAGAVVLAGGYAQALPGKSAGSGTPSKSAVPSAPGTVTPRTSTPVTRTSAARSSAPTTSAPAPVLQAPTQAPTTAAAAPSTTHATSGGS